MPDPLQSLSEIVERCREMQRACNPSKLPILAADVAELADILRKLVKDDRPEMMHQGLSR